MGNQRGQAGLGRKERYENTKKDHGCHCLCQGQSPRISHPHVPSKCLYVSMCQLHVSVPVVAGCWLGGKARESDPPAFHIRKVLSTILLGPNPPTCLTGTLAQSSCLPVGEGRGGLFTVWRSSSPLCVSETASHFIFNRKSYI